MSRAQNYTCALEHFFNPSTPGEKRKRPSIYFFEAELPQTSTNMRTVVHIWSTKPTAAQNLIIQNGTKEQDDLRRNTRLPNWYSNDLEAFVYPDIIRRKEFDTVVANHAIIEVSPIQGLALLRTCKQIHEEGTDILYGENVFNFNRDSDSWEKSFNTVLNVKPHLIPGLATYGSGGIGDVCCF